MSAKKASVRSRAVAAAAVVGAALVAVEAMLGGIDVHLDFWLRLLKASTPSSGIAVVLLAEMAHDRAQRLALCFTAPVMPPP